MNKYFIDLDDFCEDNEDWLLVRALKERVPALKLNLFTIVGRCTDVYIKDTREEFGDWIRLYPHGYMHNTSRECQNWPYDVANNYLAQLERTGWPKVWKSPGWMTSQDLMQCLADRNWIIADQEYNNDRRPAGLKVYLLDSPWKIHGHIGHWGEGVHNANSLEYLFDTIAALKGEFGFIDEIWDGI